MLSSEPRTFQILSRNADYSSISVVCGMMSNNKVPGLILLCKYCLAHKLVSVSLH